MVVVNVKCYNSVERMASNMRKKVDATKGSIVPLIFTYAIPLVFSTVLQHFFEIADKAVLGNMAGSTAVASVGATGVVTSLIINGAVGNSYVHLVWTFALAASSVA